MKKIIILTLMLSVIGCAQAIRHTAGTFEHIVIRKSTIQNPTFSVYVEERDPYTNIWLKEKIETALMQNNVSVLLFSNTKQLVTTTTGDEKDVSAHDNTGTKLHKGNIDIKSTTQLQSQVKADYLFQANYYPGTFSVISMKNLEIIAKGKFTSFSYEDDIKKNVKTILQEMGIIP